MLNIGQAQLRWTGDHGGFPVEALAYGADRSFAASISHDDVVRFFDCSNLDAPAAAEESDSDSDSDSSDSSAPKRPAKKKRKPAAPSKPRGAFYDDL